MPIHSDFYQIPKIPRPSDPQQVEHTLSRLKHPRLQTLIGQDSTAQALIEALTGNSPYLAGLVIREPDTLYSALESGPNKALQQATQQLESIPPASEKEVMARLRQVKRQSALTIALADVTGLWPLEQITKALSDLASICLDFAIDSLLLQAAARGDYQPADPQIPTKDSGIIILGMGKLGASELNYSSDIDLIILYDPSRLPYQGRRTTQQFMTGFARDLTRLMEERTGDGYVFRTDLRLRPDPSSTPLAVPLPAAFAYYESTGQNWERAAFIKARPVAADRVAGEDFLHEITPFIWRRSLDFYSLDDIKSIKRQIDARHGPFTPDLLGHNLKLGNGGIREIEFFAQTQQLIWGGRNPGLRTQSTCNALFALAEEEIITTTEAEELSESYRFLRQVEHRIQMTNDNQTHSLPQDETGFSSLATFLGYDTPEDFRQQLHNHLQRVKQHFATLFEEDAGLGSDGNLVFTGTDDDPDTVKTLQEMGFADPGMVIQAIRDWHYGNARATRSKRAREVLTEITPRLLQALSRAVHPNAAFRKFDEFLHDLPAGVQIFSLFHANPALMDLVADIMGGAPNMAERLAKHPDLLDAVLSGDFLGPLPDRETLTEHLRQSLKLADHPEARLYTIHRFAEEYRFQAGIHLLRYISPLDIIQTMLSDIADISLAALLETISAEFTETYGHIDGASLAIIALGKLGSQELTFGSDLDLILVYGGGESSESSDGEKQLSRTSYFLRLAQRFVHNVTSQGPDGRLYELDLRLRPFGEDSAIATPLEGFADYYTQHAWDFERMALTRSRVIVGPDWIKQKLESIIHTELTQPREQEALKNTIRDMREKIFQKHPVKKPWRVKYVRGGLTDIAFIVQYLQLLHAHNHPDILATGIPASIQALERHGFLSADQSALLQEAQRAQTTIQAGLRMAAASSDFDPDTASGGLKRLLLHLTALESIEIVEATLVEIQQKVHKLFLEFFEPQSSGDTS